MEFKIIATRDIKADVYSVPMFVPHIGQAIRSFGDACSKKDNDPNNVLGNHSEDFELMHLGDYDDTNGHFKLLDAPVQLAVGSNYKV